MQRGFGRIFVAAAMALAACSTAGAVPAGQSAPLNDVSGLNVTAPGSNVGRTAGARAADEINALDFTTFALAVAQAASTGKPLHLRTGAYSYTSGTVLTISAPVIFDPGAVLTCSGVNVGFTGPFQGPRAQIFASGCTPSFSGGNSQSAVFPEWWGAIGDATGAVGVGHDNTTPLLNAINSGAARIELCVQCTYRYTTLPTTRSTLTISGTSRDSSGLLQDDPTGLLDGLKFWGRPGRITIRDLSLWRAQAAIASVASATVVAGGSGYAVNDTLTVAGGVYSTQAVLKVSSVSSGAITGLSVQTGGAYTQQPRETVTKTSTPAVAQSATSGSGTGASFTLLMNGPAILHFQDSYYVQILHNYIGGNYAWNGLEFDSLTNYLTDAYVQENQIFSGENDGVYAYTPWLIPLSHVHLDMVLGTD